MKSTASPRIILIYLWIILLSEILNVHPSSTKCKLHIVHCLKISWSWDIALRSLPNSIDSLNEMYVIYVVVNKYIGAKSHKIDSFPTFPIDHINFCASNIIISKKCHKMINSQNNIKAKNAVECPIFKCILKDVWKNKWYLRTSWNNNFLHKKEWQKYLHLVRL